MENKDTVTHYWSLQPNGEYTRHSLAGYVGYETAPKAGHGIRAHQAEYTKEQAQAVIDYWNSRGESCFLEKPESAKTEGKKMSDSGKQIGYKCEDCGEWVGLGHTVSVCRQSQRDKNLDALLCKQPEQVDHPQHYGGDTPYEAIKVIEAWGLGFCLGNTVKYISRAGKKTPDLLVDLKKSFWYLKREIENLEKDER